MKRQFKEFTPAKNVSREKKNTSKGARVGHFEQLDSPIYEHRSLRFEQSIILGWQLFCLKFVIIDFKINTIFISNRTVILNVLANYFLVLSYSKLFFNQLI